MQKSFLPIILAAALWACNNEKTPDETAATMTHNTLSGQEKAGGWQLLFDGHSTSGWHKYGGGPVGSAWKVEDSTLRLEVSELQDWQIKNGGDIVTDEEYENFHLKLEWKIDTGGNSGVIFLIHEDTVKYQWPWHTGLEMQILDNAAHKDAGITKHRAGDLYDLISCSKETVKPALQWNQVEIKHVNGKLDFWLNGENVVATTIGDEQWKEMLKNSKWKDYPDFSTYKKGRIGLQDHGNNVWFRNIKIKKL